MGGKKMIRLNQFIHPLLCLFLCALLALPAACSTINIFGTPSAGDKDSVSAAPVNLFPSKPKPTSPLPLPINRPAQITFQSDTVLYAAVSGDGKRMVYLFIDNGFSRVWIGSPDPDQLILPRKLYHTTGNLSSPALSQDGRWMAFAGTDYDAMGDIFLLEVDNPNSAPQRLTG